MRGMRKHVHDAAGLQLIAVPPDEFPRITRQCCRVTGYVYDPPGAQPGNQVQYLQCAGTGRIQQYFIVRILAPGS